MTQFMLKATPDVEIRINSAHGPLWIQRMDSIYPGSWADQIIYVPATVDYETGKEIPARRYVMKFEEVKE